MNISDSLTEFVVTNKQKTKGINKAELKGLDNEGDEIKAAINKEGCQTVT